MCHKKEESHLKFGFPQICHKPHLHLEAKARVSGVNLADRDRQVLQKHRGRYKSQT